MNSPSQGVEPAMITTDCPWCDGPAEVAGENLHCPHCSVTVQIAEELTAAERAAA